MTRVFDFFCFMPVQMAVNDDTEKLHNSSVISALGRVLKIHQGKSDLGGFIDGPIEYKNDDNNNLRAYGCVIPKYKDLISQGFKKKDPVTNIVIKKYFKKRPAENSAQNDVDVAPENTQDEPQEQQGFVFGEQVQQIEQVLPEQSHDVVDSLVLKLREYRVLKEQSEVAKIRMQEVNIEARRILDEATAKASAMVEAAKLDYEIKSKKSITFHELLMTETPELSVLF